MGRLGGFVLLYKVGVDAVVGLMGHERCQQGVGFEPLEVPGGLQHGAAGPADRHLGIPLALAVRQDGPDARTRVRKYGKQCAGRCSFGLSDAAPEVKRDESEL